MYNLLRHVWLLQSCVAVSDNSLVLREVKHCKPPAVGKGLSHVRFRVCLPPAHVTLQAVHELQLPQVPLTTYKIMFY